MSVLVIVEMFNALIALSENRSLAAVPPARNPWLLAAIAVSVLLHLLILYAPLVVCAACASVSYAHTGTVQVCVAVLLQVFVAALLELSEPPKPAEMLCLQCNKHAPGVAVALSLL